jgi:hypothetical protein
MDPRVKTATTDLTLQFSLSRQVDQVMRRLMTARAAVAARLATAAAEAAPALQATAAELQAAYAPLPGWLGTLQEADVRPLPAVETAVRAAIARADAVIASVR